MSDRNFVDGRANVRAAGGLPVVTRQAAWRCLAALWLVCQLTQPCFAADRDVIINEIMYNPPGDLDALQYIELFNRGPDPVDLSNWSFTKGIQFKFPPGTALAPGAYQLVCRDRQAIATHYGQELTTVGPFTGRLSHKGDRLEISNSSNAFVDSVKYADADPWPRGPDGYSASLERICPAGDADTAENWAGSILPPRKRAAGTPGRVNESFATNLPPAIAQVEYDPKAPLPQQPVKVTAKISDADGIKSATLFYRVAGTGRESEERPIAMKRIGGDDKTGVYTATIGGQTAGQLVRFRVQATDALDTMRFQPSPNEPRPAYSYYCFTNTVKARIGLGQVINVSAPTRSARASSSASRRAAAAGGRPVRGNAAFVYVSENGEAQTFDFVRVVGRKGGYKVHFQDDQKLKGMSVINLISEGPLRWILAEALAYHVYSLAGVPAPQSEHVRLAIDTRILGVHLLVEQPNKSFLARNKRDDSGNLYKLLWYGDGVIGQHEKKTNPHNGHTDLVQLIQGLRRKSGADQWTFIQQQFNVEEAANYYAVNMCIQNWDGFFNNYFTYHDTGGTGKWEIYPWDEDKTFGDYDGASPRYDWYEMPLTMGMNGDSSPRDLRSRFLGGGGPFGGVDWWRPPGYFSGPLLANPEFRKVFLERLRVICTTAFTEETLGPVINAMEQRLEPEMRWRAEATGADPQPLLREFAGYMRSFREQVKNRRKFILAELARHH